MSLLLKHISSGGGATVIPPVGDLTYLGFAPSFVTTILTPTGDVVYTGLAPAFVTTTLIPVGDLTYTGFTPSVAITPSTIVEIVRPTPRRRKTPEEIAEEIRQQRIKFGVLPADEIPHDIADKKTKKALNIPELKIDESALVSSLKDEMAIARYKALVRELEILVVEYNAAVKLQEDEDMAIALLLLAA